MEWMLMPLKRYADFSGRSRRKEYWMFVLFQILVICALLLVAAIFGAFSAPTPDQPFGAPGTAMTILIMLVALFFFIPGLAVTVRRFHDQDKSGWFVLLMFIPYLGGLIIFVFMLLDGTRGENRFGPDPKGPDHSQVFA